MVEREEETEKGKKLKATLEPEVHPQDKPGGLASGSGIKRPAPDPPEDPRLEPDPSETQLDTPMEDSAGSAQPSRGTKRDADAAGVTVEPMDDEIAITNLLLSHRKGFLGALHAKLQESPEVLPVCEEQFDIDPEAPWYYDDVSGKPLDTQMVQAARREECQVIQTMGVWEPIPRPKNEKVISTRWVDVNKGDEQRPKYRSRLVARELKVKSGQSETHWSDFFASMPPITALRILLTIAVTKKIPNKDGKLIPLDPTTCLIFIDIKKAHFWSC